MNIHFIDKKVLYFDKNNNLTDDENFSPLVVLVVHMGSCEGIADNIVDIIKDFVSLLEKTKRNDIYIYDKSTEKDFWFCVV